VTRLLAIAWKELIQLRRDRITMGMVVMMPLVQLLLFGFAIDTDVRHIATVVFDQDRSVASRRFVAHLEATKFNDVAGHVRSYREIDDAFKSGTANVAIVVPSRFQADILQGRGSAVQVLVNGVDPNTVGSALSAAEGLAGSVSARIGVMRAGWQGRPMAPNSVRVQALVKYNPDQRSAVFIVPGLIGVILTMTMVMFTSMALARERERGTLEALIVSPARSIEIIAGKILPYVMVGYLQMTIVLYVGHLVFDVPVRGSLPLLYATAAAFISGNLAVGLLFSTIAKTQQQAMQLSFFFLLPNILLSGFMFPFEAMPKPAQWLSQALPLTHFVRIVRRIMLQASDTAHVMGELYWLLGIFAALVLATSLRFSKKLLRAATSR
jgi:ABC-2 type transport system permease protein